MITYIVLCLCGALPIEIAFPVDGAMYDECELETKVFFDFDNLVADSIIYSLNSSPYETLLFQNTDWYTYMGNENRTGYSESSAPSTSNVLWTAPVGGGDEEFCTPVIVDGIVYFCSHGQETIFALDALTGEEIWNRPNSGVHDDPPLISDGKLYQACDSVLCLDPLTGAKSWSFGVDEGGNFAGPPVLLDGRIFIVWNATLPGYPYVTGCTVFALDSETGAVEWSNSYTDRWSTCSITARDNVVFIPFKPQFFPEPSAPLCAFNAENGNTIWSYYPDTMGFHDSTPTLATGDTLFIGTNAGHALAMNTYNGDVIWESELSAGYPLYISSTPGLHANRVFLGVNYQNTYCLNSQTGYIYWERNIPLHGSTANADGVVFLGDDIEGDVYALDEETGATIWMFDAEPGVYGLAGSPAVTNGIMYFPLGDGNLYAFGTGYVYTYKAPIFALSGANTLVANAYLNGSSIGTDSITFYVDTLGIESPVDFSLSGVTPNPASTSTSISFQLNTVSNVSIQAYDISGRFAYPSQSI